MSESSEGKPSLFDEFDWYSREIVTAQGECERTYIKWNEACQRLSKLERERGSVWRKMVDGLRR